MTRQVNRVCRLVTFFTAKRFLFSSLCNHLHTNQTKEMACINRVGETKTLSIHSYNTVAKALGFHQEYVLPLVWLLPCLTIGLASTGLFLVLTHDSEQLNFQAEIMTSYTSHYRDNVLLSFDNRYLSLRVVCVLIRPDQINVVAIFGETEKKRSC